MIDIKKYNIEALNKMSKNTMVEWLGIEITELGENYLKAKMPVDHRTVQPARILHGGASVVLAETLGSIGGSLCIDPAKQYCVGLEINANHIRPAKDGYVYGHCEILHLGKKTQIWEIKIYNEEKKLVCISRLTLAVIEK